MRDAAAASLVTYVPRCVSPRRIVLLRPPLVPRPPSSSLYPVRVPTTPKAIPASLSSSSPPPICTRLIVVYSFLITLTIACPPGAVIRIVLLHRPWPNPSTPPPPPSPPCAGLLLCVVVGGRTEDGLRFSPFVELVFGHLPRCTHLRPQPNSARRNVVVVLEAAPDDAPALPHVQLQSTVVLQWFGGRRGWVRSPS